MRRGATASDEPSLFQPGLHLRSYLSHSQSSLNPSSHQRTRQRRTPMNSFWDFVDWLLPPVRIVDDLTDHPSDYAPRSRSSHHHSSHRHSSREPRRPSGRDHDKDRERERDRDRDRDRERRKEKERAREGERDTRPSEREREREREREQFRQRIQQLERENETLIQQLRTTREELSKLTSDVFPPMSQSYPASPPDPSPLANAHSPASPLSPTSPPSDFHLSLSPTTTDRRSQAPPSPLPLSTEHSAEAALADPRRLRLLYNSLRATYTDARHTIRAQAEELAALKSFLSKTDDWSGAQLLQALADLNSEIVQLSASVAEEFANALRADVPAPPVARERDRQIVKPALGREMLRLLESRDHAADPTLVQFALQAWEVWCVSRVMDAFCYGLPGDVDEALRLVFERMQREEPQPTTSRWRALTYKHARSLLARASASPSEPHSPDSDSETDTVTPSPFNSAASSLASSSSLSPALLALTEANLRGVIAILALAGCTDARGLHRDPLRERFGSALARVSARAERISSVMKEGVLSGLFDVVWIPPCPVHKPKSRPRPRSSSQSAANANADVDVDAIGANRGKGKEREWVQEVERARRADDDDGSDHHHNSNNHIASAEVVETDRKDGQESDWWFDWDTMENVYAGHCNEHCRVLCTVELGLAFSRRLPEEEEREESVDGDGMVVGSRPTSRISEASRPVSIQSASRTASMGGIGIEGVVGVNGVSNGSAGPQTRASSGGSKLMRNLLLKPKVLLESVVDIL